MTGNKYSELHLVCKLLDMFPMSYNAVINNINQYPNDDEYEVYYIGSSKIAFIRSREIKLKTDMRESPKPSDTSHHRALYSKSGNKFPYTCHNRRIMGHKRLIVKRNQLIGTRNLDNEKEISIDNQAFNRSIKIRERPRR